jgi:hypothetical protein
MTQVYVESPKLHHVSQKAPRSRLSSSNSFLNTQVANMETDKQRQQDKLRSELEQSLQQQQHLVSKTYSNFFPLSRSPSSPQASNASLVASTLLLPLAQKEIRNKRSIEFIFSDQSPYSALHPKPYRYAYPPLDFSPPPSGTLVSEYLSGVSPFSMGESIQNTRLDSLREGDQLVQSPSYSDLRDSSPYSEVAEPEPSKWEDDNWNKREEGYVNGVIIHIIQALKAIETGNTTNITFVLIL